MTSEKAKLAYILFLGCFTLWLALILSVCLPSGKWTTPIMFPNQFILLLFAGAAILASFSSLMLGLNFLGITLRPRIQKQNLEKELLLSTEQNNQPPKIEPDVGEEAVSSFATKSQIEHIVPQEVVSSSVAEPRIELAVHEEQVSPSETQPQSACGLVKCAHCGNAFSEPLRNLDFLSDTPRIVNACPTCSREINPVVNQGESKQIKKTIHEKKGKDRMKSFYLFGENEFIQCAHEFGYLSGVVKTKSIPDECFGCPKLIECTKVPEISFGFGDRISIPKTQQMK